MTQTDLPTLTAALLQAQRERAPRVLLVAISGIDGSGKTWLAAQLASVLTHAGLGVAVLGADAWRSKPSERYSAADSGAHFYRHAYRFDALFNEVVDPLRRDGRIATTVTQFDRAGEAIPAAYEFSAIDVILLEGSFLLQRKLLARFDVRVWVECPLDVALARALRRNQEGLPPAELTAAYRRYYFPAQEYHLAADDPRAAADWVYLNASM